MTKGLRPVPPDPDPPCLAHSTRTAGISRELDGPLPYGRRLRLRLHLLWCDACRRFARQAVFLRTAMQRYRE
jgi:hypothetical protein